MKTKVFSIYDTKAKVYNLPFYSQQVASAIRMFGDVANDRNTSINKHPADYVLYEIGTFDDQEGVLTALIPYGNLGYASDYIDVVKKPVMPQIAEVINVDKKGV